MTQLYIKERVFSWTDQFSVMDETGNPKYTVEGEFFSWGKKLHVYDRNGNEAAFIKQELFTLLPRFTVYSGGREIGAVQKELSLFIPRYSITGLGWEIEGSFWEHEFRIVRNGRVIATMEKQWMTWGDSYLLTVADSADEIPALAVVLAIDCVAEQRDN